MYSIHLGTHATVGGLTLSSKLAHSFTVTDQHQIDPASAVSTPASPISSASTPLWHWSITEQLGKERVSFILQRVAHHPSNGRNSRQEPGGLNWCRSPGRGGMLFMAGSACLLIPSRTTRSIPKTRRTKKLTFCSRVIQPRQESRNVCVSSTLSLSEPVEAAHLSFGLPCPPSPH